MERTNYSKRLPDIILNSPSDNFTIVPNEIARNPNLSWKAKGLLLLLLGNHDNEWYSYKKTIIRFGKDGEQSVDSGISELEKEGYLIRLRYRDIRKKQIQGSIWICVGFPNTFDWEIIHKRLYKHGLEPVYKESPKLENLNVGSLEDGRPLTYKTPLEGNPPRRISGLNKTICNKTNLKEDNEDTKVSSPVLSEPINSPVKIDPTILSILEYWNSLPNTIKHNTSPSTKTFQTIQAYLNRLLKGYPILERQDHSPHKALLSFMSKHNLDSGLTNKIWTATEICSVLKQVVTSGSQVYGLPEVLFNNFSNGGAFSRFLFEADKKSLPTRYMDMATKLAVAIGYALTDNKQLDWAREFRELNNSGERIQDINKVLDWYVKNFNYQWVRSVSDAKEFRLFYKRICKSMDIQISEEKGGENRRNNGHPTLSNSAHSEDSDYSRVDKVMNNNDYA